MSSLGNRLRRAQQPTSNTDASGGEEGDAVPSTRVMPLSSCVQFLNSHPFVTMFRLDANVLHTAIVHLDNYLTQSRSTSSVRVECTAPPSTEKKRKPVGGCFECHGYLLLDEHNGYEVCSKCGLVQTLRGINVTPEYNAGVDVDTLQPMHKRAKGVHGVPQWMIQALHPTSEPSYMEELHHMNAFTNIGIDDLTACNNILNTWSGGHFPSEVRVAACLLHHLLRDRFTDERDVRRRVGTVRQQNGTENINGVIRHTWSITREPMPVIDRIDEAPRFACPTCGRMEHTRKGATFHCKGSSEERGDQFIPIRRRRGP